MILLLQRLAQLPTGWMLVLTNGQPNINAYDLWRHHDADVKKQFFIAKILCNLMITKVFPLCNGLKKVQHCSSLF